MTKCYLKMVVVSVKFSKILAQMFVVHCWQNKKIIFAAAALEISACGFRYIIQGLLKGGSKGFHKSNPHNFVGSTEPMEPTLMLPLPCINGLLAKIAFSGRNDLPHRAQST